MSDTQSLTATVDSLEAKAERKRKADDIDGEVDRSHDALGRINNELDDLAEAVSRLQFYREILVEAFDGDEPASVGTALANASDAIEKDSDDLVRCLRDGDSETVRGDIADSVDEVKKAKRQVKTRLKDEHWSGWNERLTSAKELQRILGGSNSEFETTINWIDGLVNSDMRNPDQRATSIVKQWDRAAEQWEDHQDLQGLSQFQKTYAISDDAVETIRTLSQESTTLDAVDVEILSELKRIDELAEAISLEI
jgi:hypothetical protein